MFGYRLVHKDVLDVLLRGVRAESRPVTVADTPVPVAPIAAAEGYEWDDRITAAIEVWPESERARLWAEAQELLERGGNVSAVAEALRYGDSSETI